MYIYIINVIYIIYILIYVCVYVLCKIGIKQKFYYPYHDSKVSV